MEWVASKENLFEVAESFWLKFDGQKNFAIHGEMGSGKTTFILALCRKLGAEGHLGSPSFSIINEYRYPQGLIYHVDLYRLKDYREVVRAGVEECLYSGQICLVEWPERAPEIFPPETVRVYLELAGPESRKIRVARLP
jgi:tRNA threonylcarbamoyladenosine biosynthesis protein TsaE